MKKFNKLNISQTESTTNKVTFTIKNLEKGFGITLGNALRRVLLSNIPGSAMFAVKIKGVKHEFEPINGVKEDAITVILNLKNLALRIDENAYSDDELANRKLENWPVLKLSHTGKGVITAKDIELPSGFEIINKDLYIASCQNDNSKLEIDIYANRGRGFVSFIQNRELINSLEIIPTDSNYSPIVHVAYSVEEQKATKESTCDELKIAIATDGSITPIEAISLAAKILVEHLNVFVDLGSIASGLQVMSAIEQASSPSVASISTLSTPITDLNLTTRSYNCLVRQGIKTVQEILNMNREQIASIKNLGKKSLYEIMKVLKTRGYEIKKT